MSPRYVPDPDQIPADDLIELLGAEVASRYAAAELTVTEQIAKRAYRILDLQQAAADNKDLLAQQRALQDLAVARQQALAELRQVADREAKRLRDAGLAEQVMSVAAKDGEAAAAARLKLASRLPNKAGVVGSAAQAVGALTLDLHSRLEFLNARITRYPDDAYKQIISETSPRLMLGVETNVLNQRRAVQTFLTNGLDGFTDKAGRNWRIGSYAEMATRTATQRGWQDAGIWRMQQSGINLVTIMGGLDACSRCVPWFGLILSTDGSTGTIDLPHSTEDGMESITIQGTLEQARGAGWGHPNCRDTLQSFLPGLTIPQPQIEYDAGAADERQQQRYLERRIRSAKRKAAVSGDDVTRARASRQVKDAQADMRQFLKDTGRNRSSYREQLHFSDGR